ncbi:hypothetical protein ACROYT_G013237 [Oculina patagonica]
MLRKMKTPKENILKTFITLHRLRCCQDCYPGHLLSEWDRWKEEHKSYNNRPDIFQSNQFFIVFEFTNGGTDLTFIEI